VSLEKVKALMEEAGWGSLATGDGQKVGCRPMGGWAWMAGELWCASGKSSDKIAQLGSVPYAEYCFATREGRHVRIAGPCTVSTDDQDKRKLYEAVPALKEHVSDPASPDYVVIRMTPERIRLMADTGTEHRDVALA